MNYSALFNFLYSTEISEATKTEIVEKINYPIQESANAEPLVETHLELLDTLVYSTASEALIYNIIDETFSQLDEDFINEVSDEWIKRKTEAGLKAREQAANAANKSVKGGVIGLSQIRRQDQAQQKLEKGRAQVAARTPQTTSAPKSEGAMGKLKSAVGKVKSFVSSIDKGPDYASLSRAIGRKANQDNIGAEKLRQQTTHKAEAPQSDEVKVGTAAKTEAPSSRAERINKAKERAKGTKLPVGETPIEMGTRKEKVSSLKKAATNIASGKKKTEKPKKEEPVQQKLNLETPKEEEGVKSEVKADDATKAVKKSKSKTKTEPPVTETSKRRGKKTVAAAITNKEEKPVEVKAETPEVKEEKPKKRTGKITINAKGRNKKTTEEKPAETETSKVEEKPAEVQAETPAEEPKVKVDTNKKTEAQKEEAKFRREMIARRKGQEQTLQMYKERRQNMTSKPGYDQKAVEDLDKRIAELEKELGKAKVNEALSDLVITLLNTNISENCFVEVMEMVAASKANAEKALKRDEQNAMAVIDDINKDLEAGKPVDPEKVRKAEELRKKKENFENIFNKKFNDNP